MSELAVPLPWSESFLPESRHIFSADPAEVRFSYSKPQDPLWKRFIIRGIERLTGQPHLEQLYLSWSAQKHHGGDHRSRPACA